MLLAVKLLALALLLILLLRWRVDLALAVFLVTACTVVLFHVSPRLALEQGLRILVRPDAVQLMVIAVLAQYIGTIQKARHEFDRLIQSLTVIVRDRRLVAMVAPAIVGFLPMPGGALFSAPMVGEATAELKLPPAFNAFLNYWFRHDWELIWPLYSGLLLFQAMSGIALKRIILFQLPFSLLHIATGLVVAFVYFRRLGIRRSPPPAAAGIGRTLRDLLSGIWPLLVVALLFGAGVPLHWGVVVAAVLLTAWQRVGLREALAALLARMVVRSVLVIMTVLVFQRTIEISSAFDVLKTMPVSMLLAVCFIFAVSFTIGFLTGVNTAYIAIAFPILLPMISRLPGYFYLALYVYVIGFAGILCSPLHLCLVLTNEHFGASPTAVYRYLAFPILCMIGVSTLLVLVL
jgi:uncharacterized protein